MSIMQPSLQFSKRGQPYFSYFSYFVTKKLKNLIHRQSFYIIEIIFLFGFRMKYAFSL